MPKLVLSIAGKPSHSPSSESLSLDLRALPTPTVRTLAPGGEVPKPKAPAGARGVSTATVTESGSTRTLSWKLTFRGLSGKAVAAHIHKGKAGVAGAVIVPLCGPCKTGQTGRVRVSHDTADVLERGGAYVNVHTAKNAAGEIRGQIKLLNHGTTTTTDNLPERPRRRPTRGTVDRRPGTRPRELVPTDLRSHEGCLPEGDTLRVESDEDRRHGARATRRPASPYASRGSRPRSPAQSVGCAGWAGEHLEECPLLERVEPPWGQSRNGRGPNAVVEQGDLAEAVPASERLRSGDRRRPPRTPRPQLRSSDHRRSPGRRPPGRQSRKAARDSAPGPRSRVVAVPRTVAASEAARSRRQARLRMRRVPGGAGRRAMRAEAA